MSLSVVPASAGGQALEPGRHPRPAPSNWERAPTPQHATWWHVVRRQWWLIALTTGLAVLAALAMLRVMQPVYESAATVRVDPKEARLPDVYQRVATSGAVSEVGNQVDLLRSRSLAQRVVDSLGLRVQLLRPGAARSRLLADVRGPSGADTGLFTLRREGPGPGFAVLVGDPAIRIGSARVGVPVRLAGAHFALTPAAAGHERIDVHVAGADAAIDALQKALQVARTGRESQVIVVGYRSNDPLLARDVPNALVAHLLTMRRSGEQLESSSTAEVLRGQIRTVAGELSRSETTLRDFRQRERVVDPKLEASTEITRFAQLQAERAQVGSERDALAALMRDLGSPSARRAEGAERPYRQLAGFPTLLRNESTWGYVKALTEVEAQRAALLVKRMPEDSDVQALDQRAATLEGQLRATASTYLEALTRQVNALDAELGRYSRRLSDQPRKEAEFARLERGPKVLGDMLTLLQTRLKEAEVAEAVIDPSVQRLDVAPLPRKPVRPQPVQDVALAGCAGLLLGLAGAFARERLDRSVRSREDVQDWAGLPVLGVVPRLHESFLPAAPQASPRAIARPGRRVRLPGGVRRVTSADRLAAFEAFARLQTRVTASGAARDLTSVVVTSPLSGEGKTTTAGNLACVLAQVGTRTLLVDADLRRSTLHRSFGLPRGPGLAEVLEGNALLGDVLQKVELGNGAVLHVLTAGAPVDPSRRLVTPERVRAFFDLAAERYDHVVVDAPPLNLTADAAVLAAEAQGVLLVARARHTPLEALAYAAQQLADASAPTLGVVINDIDPHRDAAYDAAYRYYGDPYLSSALTA